jgi:hypothetical protein
MRPFAYIVSVTVRATVLIAAATVSGCGGSSPSLVVPNPSAPLGLPSPTAASQVNTYSGVQSPGVWSFTLDNAKNLFSYQPVTYPASPNTPVTGSIQIVRGFTKLQSSGAFAGYALEVMGRIAILRPGGVNVAPVIAVPQTGCYQLAGRSRFQYAAIPAGLAGSIFGGPTLGYGSVVASTDSTGKSWQFEDLQGNVVTGPSSFTGSCGSSNSQAALSFTGVQTVLDDMWAGFAASIPTANTNLSMSIGPSGFFVADQSDPTQAQPTGASVAGVVEPLAALKTSDIMSQPYLGFVFQAPTAIGYQGAPATSTNTYAVSFGPASSNGASLTGGDFPNDDVTQSANSDMSIALGVQDATFNGLYEGVSITVLDPAQNCANYTGPGETATFGVNAQGYATCTFSGIAVVGNPESKYGIFISTYNWAARLGGAPMEIFLLEQ